MTPSRFCQNSIMTKGTIKPRCVICKNNISNKYLSIYANAACFFCKIGCRLNGNNDSSNNWNHKISEKNGFSWLKGFEEEFKLAIYLYAREENPCLSGMYLISIRIQIHVNKWRDDYDEIPIFIKIGFASTSPNCRIRETYLNLDSSQSPRERRHEQQRAIRDWIRNAVDLNTAGESYLIDRRLHKNFRDALR